MPEILREHDDILEEAQQEVTLHYAEGERVLDEPIIEFWASLIEKGEFDALKEEVLSYVPLAVKRYLSGAAMILGEKVKDVEQLKDISFKVVETLMDAAFSGKGEEMGWKPDALPQIISSFLHVLLVRAEIPEDEAQDIIDDILDFIDQKVEEREEGGEELTPPAEEDVVAPEEEVTAPESVIDKEEEAIEGETMGGEEFASWLASQFEDFVPEDEEAVFDSELGTAVEEEAIKFFRHLLMGDSDIDSEFAPIEQVIKEIVDKAKGTSEEVSDEEMKELIKSYLLSAYCILLAKAAFDWRGKEKEEERKHILRFAERLKLWLKRLKEGEVKEGQEEEEQPLAPEEEEKPIKPDEEGVIPTDDIEVDEEKLAKVTYDKATIFVHTVLDGLAYAFYSLLRDARGSLSDEQIDRARKIKEKLKHLGEISGVEVDDLPSYPLLSRMRGIFLKAIRKAIKSLLSS